MSPATGPNTAGTAPAAHQLPYAPDERTTMAFAAAGAMVCQRATDGTGRRTEAGVRPVRQCAALGADLLATARDLAGRFDARNGTGYQFRRLADWLAEPGAPVPVPLPPDELDVPDWT